MKPDNRSLTDTREIKRAFKNISLTGHHVFLMDDYTDAELDSLVRDLRYLLCVAEGK